MLVLLLLFKYIMQDMKVVVYYVVFEIICKFLKYIVEIVVWDCILNCFDLCFVKIFVDFVVCGVNLIVFVDSFDNFLVWVMVRENFVMLMNGIL